MKQKKLCLFALLLLLVQACKGPDTEAALFRQMIVREGKQFDLWIRNGRVLNGLDSIAKYADVLIKGEEIKYLGRVDTNEVAARLVIDAENKFVTPGFIDTHAHGDPLGTPALENFLAMGVTTICLGQDGFSPKLKDLGQWMAVVDDTIPGANIAMFAGHSSLRQLSGVNYKSEPSQAELYSMQLLLQKAFDAGCFGMSTGLEYTPGIFAGEEELAALAKVVGRNWGLIMSHIRNEDDDQIEESLRELFRQGEFCRVHVSHVKVVYGKGKERAVQLLQLMSNARSNIPHTLTADIYPYNASYTGIGIVFPAWAKPPNDYEKVKGQRRQELLAFLHEKVMARNGPEATLFGTAPYSGKTLAELSREKEKPFAEILLDEIGPAGASGAYFVMDDALQQTFLADPNIMVCSDGSPTMQHPRGYGSFAKIIEEYVQKRQLFSLAEAIRKMTSLPAQTLGLKDRGLLKAGNKADILIFQPENVGAVADFSNPHQPATGFDWVIVNGRVSYENGVVSGRRYGRVLRFGGR